MKIIGIIWKGLEIRERWNALLFQNWWAEQFQVGMVLNG